MSEIGSEFWSVPTVAGENGIFPESTQWYLSGRSALNAVLVELHGCQTAAVPAWCCESMIKPFLDAGMTVRFYSPLPHGGTAEKLPHDCDVLLVMDFFGYTQPLPRLADYKGMVIRDVTHSLFSENHADAEYYFGSLRKWCGVYTGGFAWTQDGRKLPQGTPDTSDYAALREKAMRLKSRYLSGAIKDKAYLRVFEEAEALLENVGVAPAEERDVRLAKALDADMIRTRRRRNARILMKAFPELLVFPMLRDTDCPMFVPIRVPDGKRNALRKYLIDREIYCPVHWPLTPLHDPDEETKRLYGEELSLVCDQRYGKKDMCRIVETIQAFWKE